MAEVDTPESAGSAETRDELYMSTESGPRAGPERWRKIHRTTGSLFLVAFLILHLILNAAALGGEERWRSIVVTIETSKLLPVFELFIYVPLLLHVGLGIKLLFEPISIEAEPRQRAATRLRRASALVLALFLAVHLWDTRIQRVVFGATAEALHTILVARLSATSFGVPWIALLYVVGALAASLHVSLGLFEAQARSTTKSQSRLRLTTASLGVALFLMAAMTVIGLATGTRLLPAGNEGYLPCGPSAVPHADDTNSSAPPSPPR